MALCTHTSGRIQLCVKFLLIISTVSVIISFLVITPLYSATTWQSLNNTYIIQNILQSELRANKNYSDENVYTDLQSTSNETAIDFEQIDEVMKSRRKRVQEMCQLPEIVSPARVNELKISKTMERIVFSKKYQVAWCPIYKSGSSSWLEIFAKMAGALTPAVQKDIKNGRTQINNVVRKAYPRSSDRKADIKAVFNMTRFIVVRHPFERILSAYRDKLENMKNRKYYYDRYGHQIVLLYKKYRDPTSADKDKKEPTFYEFLRFIAEKHKFDEHWRPYNLECSPCAMDYQVIIKMENYAPEEQYLVNKLGLQEFVSEKNKTTTNRIYNENPRGRTGSDAAVKYYSQIPCELLKQIYEIYSEDFILFDYSEIEYYELCTEK